MKIHEKKYTCLRCGFQLSFCSGKDFWRPPPERFYCHKCKGTMVRGQW